MLGPAPKFATTNVFWFVPILLFLLPSLLDLLEPAQKFATIGVFILLKRTTVSAICYHQRFGLLEPDPFFATTGHFAFAGTSV